MYTIHTIVNKTRKLEWVTKLIEINMQNLAVRIFFVYISPLEPTRVEIWVRNFLKST